MKELIRKHLKKEVVVFIICFLLVLLFGYLIFNSYNIYIMTSKNYWAENIDAIGQSVDSVFLDINDFPQQEGNDILYIGKINSLHDLLNSQGIGTEENKRKLAKDFMNFMEVNPAYYNLRYIDENGMEIIKVENDGESLFVVEDEKLQDKSDSPYFNKIMMLDKDEIYISRLDLNVENSILENRGTEETPEYIPVIRYGMPVFDYGGKRKGFLIFDIYADYFLEDIRRASRNGDFMFLVDNNGYYLAHRDKSREFSFMFGEEDRIDIDYPDVGLEILRSFDKRFIETEDFVFTFRHIYPTVGTFEIYQGSRKIFGDKPEDEHYWVLVSVSHSSDMKKDMKNIENDFILSAIFSSLIVLLIVVLLFVILLINGGQKK